MAKAKAPQSAQIVDHSTPPEEVEAPKPLTRAESKEELKSAISDSNEVLFSATTVLTLFPDTLSIDRTKITVTKRTFISTAEVVSMRIEDILNVTANVGPFFGSVRIFSRIFNNDLPYTAGRFWREDTQKIKRIIQGYVMAMQKKIDCSALHTQELADMLDKLGEDAPTT